MGELVALTTRRASLKRRRIEVVEAITEVHGRLVVGTTKTHQRRLVPVPRFLADELAADLATKAPGDLVFTAPEGGGALRNTNFRPRFFDPTAEKAGLPRLTRTSCGTPQPVSPWRPAPTSRLFNKCSVTHLRP
jgi:hypothetical protein